MMNFVKRLDALSLDLARDLGHVTRDAQALADRATMVYRATPRAARLAQVGAALLARHRWAKLVAVAKGGEGLSDADHRELARRAAAYACELRGGIAKLAQLAACRPDLVGPIWASELARLQDDVPPIAADAIRARIEAELGKPIDPTASPSGGRGPTVESLFATFEDVPIAAASLAQVHGATLGDGTRVVVKVQVPGIEDVIAADIAALRTIAAAVGELPGVDLATLSDELSRALAVELDYLAEAKALRMFGARGVRVPRPILATERVLVMTRIDGERLTPALERMAPVERDRLIATLVDETAQQILVHGLVHADPHPGNFLVTPDGQLALLDFGCTLELTRDERRAYARLVLAIAGKQHATAAAELAQLGFVCDDPDRLVALTTALIGALTPETSVDQLDWQVAFATQIAEAKQLGGLVIPRSFVLLGRVLATIAGLLAKYRPAVQLHPIIVKHLAAAIA